MKQKEKCSKDKNLRGHEGKDRSRGHGTRQCGPGQREKKTLYTKEGSGDRWKQSGEMKTWKTNYRSHMTDTFKIKQETERLTRSVTGDISCRDVCLQSLHGHHELLTAADPQQLPEGHVCSGVREKLTELMLALSRLNQ